MSQPLAKIQTVKVPAHLAHAGNPAGNVPPQARTTGAPRASATDSPQAKPLPKPFYMGIRFWLWALLLGNLVLFLIHFFMHQASPVEFGEAFNHQVQPERFIVQPEGSQLIPVDKNTPLPKP